MTKQVINLGTSANSNNGDPLRTAFNKVNTNFTELYTLVGAGAAGNISAVVGPLFNHTDHTNVTVTVNPNTDRIELNATLSTVIKDINGSVFADDSTLLVDGVNGTIPSANLQGTEVNNWNTAYGWGDHSTVGYLTNPLQININGDDSATTVIGNNGTIQFKGDSNITSTTDQSGTITYKLNSQVVADLTGSVFADDSTILINGTNGTIQADHLVGTLPAIDGSNLTNLTSSTWATLGDKDGASGPEAIIIGENAVGGIESVAIGKGTTAGDYAQAIGNNAGNAGQGVAAVALGSQSGETSQGTKAVAVGQYAGQTTQSSQAIAIGNNAGNTTQGGYAVAIGRNAGLTTQGAGGIAVGSGAGKTTQGLSGIAIGYLAGESNQGGGAIAIGANAGTLNQAADSIILNASNTALENTQTGSFVVKPIRNAVGTTMLMYDATSGEVTHSGNVTLGGDLDVGGNSIVSASNGAINIAPDGTGTIDLSGQVKFAEGMIEKFATTNGATGVTALDCSTGNVHYLTAYGGLPAGNITANFTNLNLTAEYATNVTVIINQGGTEREITAVQIGGVAQTIVWQGNSAPTGTANGVDSFSFTILNDGGTYVVLGQMVAFGGV